MAGSAEILQEYLIKLGFVTDKLSLKKSNDGLASFGKNVLGVGNAVAKMAVAAEVAVGLFAYQMEKLYYTSKLSGASAANFKALTSAESSIGLTGGTIERVTKGINLAMNSGNPAMKSYIENVLGVKTAGRDMTDVLISSAQAIKKMSEQQGDIPAKAAAARLGFSDEDYFQIIKTDGALEKLIATDNKRKQYLTQLGLDYKKTTEAGVEYANMLDTLGFKMSALKDILFAQMLPAFKAFNNFLSRSLDGASVLLSDPARFTKNFKENIHNKLYPLDAKQKQKKQNAVNNSSMIYGAPAISSTSANASGVMQKLQAMGWSKEQAAGIAANLHTESGFKANASGDHGHAYGIAQWQDLGKNSRQGDFKKKYGKDMKGSSLDEQLAFLHYELTEGKEKAAGDKLRRAKTASEAGGIVSKYYERPMDREGQASLRSANATRLAGSVGNNGNSLVQNNTFNIAGTDGHALSKSVIAAQSRTNGDAVRALGTKVS